MMAVNAQEPDAKSGAKVTIEGYYWQIKEMLTVLNEKFGEENIV